MGLFGKKTSTGVMDVIRCDEPSYLIWKWHPAGTQVGDNKRENAIRWGSSLRVKDGEAAVFVYKQKDGTVEDFIEGPFDQTLKTANLPVLSNLVGVAYAGNSPFQAEVYFINLARIIQIKFAVPFFEVFDPRFMDYSVPVAVRGTISFSISDYRAFIKLHRLIGFNQDDFQKEIRDAVARYVKDAVANAPAQHNIPVVQLETKTAAINDAIEYDLKERLKENFGVNVSGIDIGTIEVDKTSSGYASLMSITKDVTKATIEAQTTANVKNIHDKQRVDIENYEESLRIQREEGQYAQHMHTQTANIGAFQTEKQAEVGVAGAEALGHMGENGAGGINLGSGGNGFNPAAMMAGMALGGAVGQNLAGTMNGIMSGMGTNMQAGAIPPIPSVTYYVGVNGQPIGPFDVNTLKQMVISKQFTVDSLVWKNGMAEWKKAAEVEELKSIFGETMPPIPPTN